MILWPGSTDDFTVPQDRSSVILERFGTRNANSVHDRPQPLFVGRGRFHKSFGPEAKILHPPQVPQPSAVRRRSVHGRTACFAELRPDQRVLPIASGRDSRFAVGVTTSEDRHTRPQTFCGAGAFRPLPRPPGLVRVDFPVTADSTARSGHGARKPRNQPRVPARFRQARSMRSHLFPNLSVNTATVPYSSCLGSS